MWMLKLWSVCQCLFGSFPYLLRDDKGYIVADVFVISFLFSLGELYLCYTTMNNVCGYYQQVPGSEPQLFGCYGVLITTAVLITNRILMSWRTKQLIDTIFSRIPYPNRFFTISTNLAYFEGIAMAVRLTCLWVSNPVFRQFSMLMIALGSYTLLWTPLLIQSQFIFVCSFLQSGIEKLNEVLRSGAAVDAVELRKIRMSLYKFNDYFEWTLRVFRVDLFLSVGLVIICVLLTMNDLTLTIFKAEDRNLPVLIYLAKIAYFLIFDAVYVTCSVWLVYNALEMLKSVSNTSTILYKQNTAVMDRRAKDEMVLLLEYLSGCELNMNVYGFFTIHPRFLFKTFSTVMTLFVLFIQLFQQRHV